MRYLIILLFIVVSFYSWKDRKESLISNSDEDVFEENIISSSYKRGYKQNAIDKLFESYLKTDKTLEEELDNFHDLNKKIREDQKPFDEFISRNNNYYELAVKIAKSITDSIISNQIVDILTKSEENYLKNTQKINSIDSLLANDIKLNNDLISTLKIIHSLSILEKYQENSNLDLKTLMEDEKLLRKFNKSFNEKVNHEISKHK